MPKINDCSSLEGDDVQNDEYRTSQETLKTFKLDALGCGACCCLFSFYYESERNR